MKLFKIIELKKITNDLLVNNTFDNFLFIEGYAQTFSSFHINGQLNKEYFTKEDSIKDDFVQWTSIKPIFFQIIKGKKLPLGFKLVLSYPIEYIKDLTDNVNVSGAYLNLKYTNGELSITTGLAFKNFTLDKTPETVWDSFVSDFLAKNEINFEIC